MRLARLATVLAPPLCWGCRGVAPAGQPLCGRCRATLRWLPPEPVSAAGVEVWAPLAYEGAARELVRALKFRSAAALADAMAAAIVANAPPGWSIASPPPGAGRLTSPMLPFLDPHSSVEAAGVALVPVPLHPARRRKRGFNQARLLADAVAARTGLPVADRLVRSRGPQQVGRPRAARAHPGGVHAIAPVPARALLVDDVVTTGSTLAACAAALRAAGSEETAALAYARTLAR